MPSNGHLSLPRFDAPPVIETLLSIEFSQIASLGIPHYGLYWDRIRNDFPKYEIKPPLGSQVEDFGPRRPLAIQIQSVELPALRCWFISEDETRLVQIQNDRFIYNWRKEATAETYPHYEQSIKPAFIKEFRRFAAFVSSATKSTIEVRQCEVTYVNHFERGREWKSPADVSEIFNCWSIKRDEAFLPAPEDITFQIRYRLPEDSGRLYVALQPALRKRDGEEVLQMALTARGKPKGEDLDSALAWLDLGREWVVRGFADLTTKKMHDLWKRTH